MFNSLLLRKLYIVMILSASLCVFSGIYLFSSKDQNNADKQNRKEVSTGINEKQPKFSPTPSTSEITKNDDKLYDCFSDNSLTRIVNKKYLLESSFVPKDLVNFIGNSYKEEYLQKDACISLEQLFSSAAEDGINLFLVSGYRSFDDQITLQSYYIQEQGYEKAQYIDCIPGASEHQLGLAVDLSTTEHINELTTDFAYTDAYKWLVAHCADYGFILRYPEGKQNITGIMFSPWNYRYVGVELAKTLMNNGETMEEFFDSRVD